MKPCSICRMPTDFVCVDCGIGTGGALMIYVCARPQCRDEHERDHRCTPERTKWAAVMDGPPPALGGMRVRPLWRELAPRLVPLLVSIAAVIALAAIPHCLSGCDDVPAAAAEPCPPISSSRSCRVSDVAGVDLEVCTDAAGGGVEDCDVFVDGVARAHCVASCP